MKTNSKDLSEEIADTIIACFLLGNKALIVGNGGSAAMASHMATEFMCKFEHDRIPLPAIALTTDTSFLTAMGNDYPVGNDLFARQVQALGKPNDILIIFSTSGKSMNCLKAIEEAQNRAMKIIDFPRKGKNTAEC